MPLTRKGSLAPIATLRHYVATQPGIPEHLRTLETLGILAAYVDPMCNVLTCNASFQTTLPAIDTYQSFPRWIFSPHGRATLTDHGHEAAYAVANLRGATGRFRASEQTADAVRYLGADPEFTRRWLAGNTVTYGRDSNDLIHARLATGDLASLRVAFSEIDPARHIQLLTIVAEQYSGPDLSRHIAGR